jgi:hypothetical protein
MFEQATRMRLRFACKGLCTVEDLWDMSLSQLDEIYKRLNADLRLRQEDSLLDVRTSESTALQLKINIVKHIVKTKLQEDEARENALLKAEKKRKILGIIAQKQDAELSELSTEELTRMVNEL